jgi:fatty acid desaturase
VTNIPIEPADGVSGLRRHRFAKPLLAQVRQCFESDNWHGPLEVLEHWLVVLAATATALLAWSKAPLAVALVTYVVAVFLIGGRQRALAGALHMASHGALMRSRLAGRLLGTLASGYLVLQSYTGYRSSHVINHHGFLGNPQRDPDYMHYMRSGLCGNNMSPAALRRYFTTLPRPRATMAYVGYLLRHRVLNKDEHLAETTVRLAYLASISGLLIWLGWGWPLIAFWIVPLVSTQVWIGAVAELVEHYPLIETAPRLDIHVSRNRDCGPLANFLLGEHPGEGYHLVHHLFPKVPIWRLKEVHLILLQDPNYAALRRPTNWPDVVREIFASLPTRLSQRT